MKKIIFLTVFVLFTLVACDDSLQWSEKAPNEMKWKDALNYCKNLNEGGHNDWRLPNIDELRTLIKAPGTISGGKCQISEKAGKLSSEDWSKADCDGNFDIDKNWFWSSSLNSNDDDDVWLVNFQYGALGNNYMSTRQYVRCVR